MTDGGGAGAVVVGAGLTGLAAADELVRLGRQVVVLEADEHVGGMATSFTLDGHVFDVGPHGLSHPDGEAADFLQPLVGDVVFSLPLVRKVYRGGQLYENPLSLPDFVRRSRPDQAALAIAHYVVARALLPLRRRAERSFTDWCRNRYGSYLYDFYIRDYSRKSWGDSVESLPAAWASQRVYDPTPSNIWRDVRGRRPVEREQFYCEGGIGTIARRLVDRIEAGGGKVVLGAPVTSVRTGPSGVAVTCADGSRYDGTHAVWTAPLDVLAATWEGQPGLEGVEDALSYRGAMFVYLDAPGVPVGRFTSCYFADPAVRFCRIYEPAWYARRDPLPEDRAGFCIEYHIDEDHPLLTAADDEVARQVVAELGAVSFLAGREFRLLKVHRLPRHYPLLDDRASKAVDTIVGAAIGAGVVPAGRMGLFRYVNMDKAIEMGLLAARVAAGSAVADDLFAVGRDATFREDQSLRTRWNVADYPRMDAPIGEAAQA